MVHRQTAYIALICSKDQREAEDIETSTATVMRISSTGLRVRSERSRPGFTEPESWARRKGWSSALLWGRERGKAGMAPSGILGDTIHM